MIERYSITATAETIGQRYAVDVPDFYKPRYNAAPTQLLPVITSINPEGLSLFYWGSSPEWAKNKTPAEKIINVRTESLLDKPALKRAMMKLRCIVPADGFYGWKKIGKKTRIPYRFVLQNKTVFSMAGIWEEFEDGEGQTIHTFMVFTTTSNDIVSPVQERMPVILDQQGEKIWLNKDSSEEDLNKLFVPFPAESINLYTVSPRINELSADVPSLIMPAPPADQFGNLTLFD